MLLASRIGKRYQPGARGGCAESAFGKKFNIKYWVQCDLRWSNRDFINYDSNNLIPLLQVPAHGNLAPHSKPYFLQLHLSVTIQWSRKLFYIARFTSCSSPCTAFSFSCVSWFCMCHCFVSCWFDHYQKKHYYH